jgi:radical SAM protein
MSIERAVERMRVGKGGRFGQAPFLVIWETTQACDLACKHCRAEAQPDRHPDELTTQEAKSLLKDIRRFGPIVFVFSGGDALKRPDLEELIEYGSGLGLRMAATPAATPLATEERIRGLELAGLTRLAISLDGSNPLIHDEFRQVEGSFDEAIRVLATAREAGMSTRVNTVITRHNLHDFDALGRLMGDLGIRLWEVFLLVPMGRAKRSQVASATEFEDTFHRLYELAESASFDVKATVAPHYNRVVLQRKAAAAEDINAGDTRRRGSLVIGGTHDPLTAGTAYSYLDRIRRARNVNDGDGFLFVSHTGEIMPSGFLPLAAGNVRTDDIVQVYRNSELFRNLRDRSLLKGKCGHCEFRDICGGSRARAWAVTGDHLSSEPYCSHTPEAWRNRKLPMVS